jgi:LPXTG-motif cell wall-anchored protein
MKLKLVTAVSAVVALALIAGPAAAIHFPASSNDRGYAVSVIDRSSLFSDTDLDGFLEPEAAGSSVDVGDEQRTVFSVNSIDTGDVATSAGTGLKRVNATDTGVVPNPSLLSGMMYDLAVSSVGFDIDLDFDGAIDPGEQADIYKTRAGRYLSAGGSDGTWADRAPSPSDGFTAADTVSGVDYGGILVVYEDPAKNTSFSTAGQWREHGDTSAPNPHPGAATMIITSPSGTVMTTADYFPSISDVVGTSASEDSGTATPWLVAVLLDMSDIPAVGGFPANPLGLPAGTFLVENNFSVDGTTFEVSGDGLAFANIIGGTSVGSTLWEYDKFSRGAWRADLRIDFELGPNDGTKLTADGWQVISDDPVQFGVMPEPATMTLLGLSLLGLAGLGYWRKKK